MSYNYLAEYNYKVKKHRNYLQKIGLNYNEEWTNRNTYLKFTYKLDYLNSLMLRQNKTPIFLTITLPGEYHPKSKKYNKDNTIEKGYKKLQEIFRYIYRNFKVDRQYKKLKFVRVIEPHKSYIPHLHGIVWVDTDLITNFLKHFSIVVIKYELQQTDIKVLDTADYAVVYLLKYIKKSLEDITVLGWKYAHNIRVFSMSNLNLPLKFKVFDVATSFVAFNSKLKEQHKKNYIEQILDKISIDLTITNLEDFSILKTYKNVGSSDLHIVANIAKYKTSKKYKDLEDLEDLEDIELYDRYEIIDLKVYKNNNLFYDIKHCDMQVLQNYRI
jgi:hypothetical protein